MPLRIRGFTTGAVAGHDRPIHRDPSAAVAAVRICLAALQLGRPHSAPGQPVRSAQQLLFYWFTLRTSSCKTARPSGPAGLLAPGTLGIFFMSTQILLISFLVTITAHQNVQDLKRLLSAKELNSLVGDAELCGWLEVCKGDVSKVDCWMTFFLNG